MKESEKLHIECVRKASSVNAELHQFLEDQIQKLEEKLKCPVCLMVVEEVPIFTCSRQHHFCAGCWEEMHKSGDHRCPVCRVALKNNPPNRHRCMEERTEELKQLKEKLHP